MYSRGSRFLVFVFDITSRKSFSQLEYWFQGVMGHQSRNHCQHFALVGTKIDREHEREVPREEAERWCKENFPGFNYWYFETSSKTGIGVDDLFETISKSLQFLKQKSDQPGGANVKSVVRLRSSRTDS